MTGVERPEDASHFSRSETATYTCVQWLQTTRAICTVCCETGCRHERPHGCRPTVIACAGGVSVVTAAPADAAGSCSPARHSRTEWGWLRHRLCRRCHRRTAAADDGPRRRGSRRNREPALPSPPSYPTGHGRGANAGNRPRCAGRRVASGLSSGAQRFASPRTKPLARLPFRCAASRRGPGWVPTSRPGLRAAARSSCFFGDEGVHDAALVAFRVGRA